MFTALYFLGLGTELLSLPPWLVAGYLAGRLGTARTVRALRLPGGPPWPQRWWRACWAWSTRG